MQTNTREQHTCRRPMRHALTETDLGVACPGRVAMDVDVVGDEGPAVSLRPRREHLTRRADENHHLFRRPLLPASASVSAQMYPCRINDAYFDMYRENHHNKEIGPLAVQS